MLIMICDEKYYIGDQVICTQITFHLAWVCGLWIINLSDFLMLWSTKVLSSVCLVKIIFVNLFYYLIYFLYYLWVSLHFLVLFVSLTVLFQLTFTFIYSIFSKKI